MAKYDKYVLQNPVDHGQMLYTASPVFDANVWYMGDDCFGGAGFSTVMRVINSDLVMEEFPHWHDFDMWVWQVPFDPENFEDLGCEAEMVFGAGTEDDPTETYVMTKTSCFFIPAGVVHSPYVFRNVTKPILFIHAMLSGDYHKNETIFIDPK